MSTKKYLTRLQYIEKKSYLPFSYKQNSSILYISAILPAHKMTLNIILYGSQTTRAFRFGISAKQLHLSHKTARVLNFSKRFSSTGKHRLSHNPQVNLEITKEINVTEELTESDATTITGLWLPTFTFDTDQMFINIDNPLNSTNERFSATHSSTTISIFIRETMFFVKNKQKPIARRAEIIFHTILFIGVCIDLLAMMFLLLNLWIVSPMKFFLKDFIRPTNRLYYLIFDEKDENAKQQVSSDIVRLEAEVNILKIKLEESNATMHAFMSSMSADKQPLEYPVQSTRTN